MTTSRPGVLAEAGLMEDEIDLRKYIDVMVRWWREIVGLTLVAAIAAAVTLIGMRILGAPVYKSAAAVAIVRVKSDITFDPRFKTTSEQTAQSLVPDAAARRAALVGLASSGAIAQAVIAELGDQLTAEEKNPAVFSEAVTASASADSQSRTATASDLIWITAHASSAEKAAAIANAWARAYVQQVNAIYGQVPDDLFSSVKAELDKAQVEYQTTQADLEAFVADNRIAELSRLIAEKEAMIASYNAALTANRLVAFEREQAGEQALVRAYLDAQSNARLAVFNEQHQRDVQMLATYHALWRQTSRFLDDARSLRAQVASGGEEAAASAALALRLLKIQIFSGLNNPPVNPQPANLQPATLSPVTPPQANLPTNMLQIQLAEPSQVSARAVLADLDALIGTLSDWLESLDRQIATLSEALLAGTGYGNLDRQMASDSPLMTAAKAQYPELFSLGESALLAERATPVTTAAPAGSEALTQAIAQLQGEVRTLKSQLEAETARQQQLAQQRDLTWNTYTTLSSKVAELNLARAGASSEVRLAAPAIPPATPVPGPRLLSTVVLAGIVGLMLALGVAFFAEYLDQKPFLASWRQAS